MKTQPQPVVRAQPWPPQQFVTPPYPQFQPFAAPMPIRNPWPEPQINQDFGPLLPPPPVESTPRKVYHHPTHFPNDNPFPRELEPYQGYYSERYGDEYTKSLELDLEKDIEKQTKSDQAETEKVLQKLKENNDPCVLDPFAMAQKAKEIKSGRLSLDTDKTLDDELDEF